MDINWFCQTHSSARVRWTVAHNSQLTAKGFIMHKNENGSINWSATIRYMWALMFPAKFPKHIVGRSLTPHERKRAQFYGGGFLKPLAALRPENFLGVIPSFVFKTPSVLGKFFKTPCGSKAREFFSRCLCACKICVMMRRQPRLASIQLIVIGAENNGSNPLRRAMKGKFQNF